MSSGGCWRNVDLGYRDRETIDLPAAKRCWRRSLAAIIGTARAAAALRGSSCSAAAAAAAPAALYGLIRSLNPSPNVGDGCSVGWEERGREGV